MEAVSQRALTRGWLVGLIAAVVLAATGPAVSQSNPNGVAVIIGNKTYMGRIPAVSYAHRDAEAIKRFLTGVLRFSPDNIIDLRDATKAEIEAAFGNRDTHKGKLWRYVNPKGKSDVVVFFSGHGVPGLSDGRGYLLPSNADPEAAEINGYPIDLLYTNLGKLKTNSLTVLIDACFSGDSAGGRLVQSASPVYLQNRLPQATGGMTVLTAARDKQLASWDERTKHGLFTEHFLQAAYGKADADGNGLITLAEIETYLETHMTMAARRRFGRDQNPTINGDRRAVLSAFVPGRAPQRPVLRDAEPKPATPPAAVATQPAAPTAQQPQAPKPAVQPAPPAQPVRTVSRTPAPAPTHTPTAPLSERSVDTANFPATYVTTANARVREGPSTATRQIATLAQGTAITVLGKVEGENWYYVAQRGRDLGFVYGTLIRPARSTAARQPNYTPPPSPGTGSRDDTKPYSGVPSVLVNPIRNLNGKENRALTQAVKGVIGSSGEVELIERGRADFVVSGRLSRFQKQRKRNTERDAANFFGQLLFGKGGQQMSQDIPQFIDQYDIELTLNVRDNRSGRTVTEKAQRSFAVPAGPQGQSLLEGQIFELIEETVENVSERFEAGGAAARGYASPPAPPSPTGRSRSSQRLRDLLQD